MKQIVSRLVLIAAISLLTGCTPKSWDGVILPVDANVMAVSPNLEWLTYEGSDVIWLASLPTFHNPVAITPTDDPAAIWLVHTSWSPDSAGFVISSMSRTEDQETWWLVSPDTPDERSVLCTLPKLERAIVWSPAANAFALISQGGEVTLVQADGSGCESLPISGLVMRTPAIAWSPDGQEIAFVEIPPEGPESAEVHSYNIGTHETRTVYSEGGLPVWFPNGEAIALMGWQGAIPVVHADGSGLIGTAEIPEGYTIGRATNGKWSPDGSRLALYLEPKRGEDAPDAVGVLYRDPLAMTVIEAPFYLEILGWTQDGTRILLLVPEPDGRTVFRELDIVP